MKIFWLILLIPAFCVDAKGLFEFKTETLEVFNGARRILASGTLKTIIDIANGISEKLLGEDTNVQIPQFGPASNMYKLKWSAKMEDLAYKRGKTGNQIPKNLFKSFTYKGFAGFEWKGLMAEIVDKILDAFPKNKITIVLKPVLNILDKFIMALLMMVNYPGKQPMEFKKDLGATEALFAHRYEIGCYAKLTYSVCFMEPSRNNGWLYEKGVPCSNCSTHCEFFEDSNGMIEEGDLCVPPEEESNFTASFVVKQENLVDSGTDNLCHLFVTLISVCIVYLYLKK